MTPSERARQRAILARRYPGRGPGGPLDDRSWMARQADHGRLFPPGVEYPADQLRRRREEREAREAGQADPPGPGRPAAGPDPADPA